jgi:hypothetical protein
LLATGTCTIVASQAGNGSYAAAANLTQSFAVSGEAQSISFGAIPSQAVGTSLTVSATASSGLAVSFSVVPNGNCSVSGNVVTFLNTGNCGVVASQAGNSVYAAAPTVGQIIVVTNFVPSGPAPNISYVNFWGVSNSGVTISWSTDIPSTTYVAYGTTNALGQTSPVQSAVSNNHGVVLTGLNAGTTYYFRAMSTSASGSTGESTVFSFTTTGGQSGAPAAPVISSVVVSGVTATSATVTWTTDQASNSAVTYGATTAYGSETGPDSSYVTSHSVTITGLATGATYNFAVVSANSAGVSSTSPNGTFTTTASTSATPPSIGYVNFWGVSDSGVTISWSTSFPSNTQLAYGTTAALGQLTPLQSALVSSHGVVLTGLSPGTTYYFVAQSTGSNGATGYSTTYSFTTLTP